MPKLYRLAEQRKRSRLTQHELAKLSGVSRPTIAAVELGYRGARMSTIRKLAKVLKVKPEDLTEPPRGRVVNMKWREPYDVYIGHQMPWRPYFLKKKSIWANPYAKQLHGEKITREECLRLYREYVLSKPELVEKLPGLRGTTLACWCAPERCHGDVLLELAWQAAEGRIEKIGA